MGFYRNETDGAGDLFVVWFDMARFCFIVG